MKNNSLLSEGRNIWSSDFLKKLIPLAITFLAGVCYYILYRLKIFAFPCPLRFWTGLFIEGGITCPGCGVTRMLNSEIHLNFAEAYYYNQAVFILQPLIFFEISKLIWCYLFEKKVKYSKIENIILIISCIILVIFCIWRNLVTFNII